MQRPGMWFALPAAALLLIFFAYPLAVSLLQSFFKTSGGVSTGDGSSDPRNGGRAKSDRLPVRPARNRRREIRGSVNMVV